MANGRHARGAEHPTAQLDSGPQTSEAPGSRTSVESAPANAATGQPVPSGRRRRVVEEPPAPEQDLPRPDSAETAAAGSGRRRRAAGEFDPARTAETPAIPAPTGRRRKTAADAPAESTPSTAAPAVMAVPAPTAAEAGTGRRRRAADTRAETPAEKPAALLDAAPRAEEPRRTRAVTPAVPGAVTAAPAVAAVETASESAAVVELKPRSHRRAAAPAKAADAAVAKPGPKHGHAKPAAAKPAAAKPAARSAAGGHAGARKKAVVLPAGVPTGTALVAGAAAVAVAAAGVIAAATSGGSPATNTAMSGAALLGDSGGTLVDSASVNREQARASRDLAREALADRTQAAVDLQQKQEAAARALAAARARAQQLAQLALSYRLPVSGYHLTAGFGERSYHWGSYHTGLDFACPWGTPIHAVSTGTVIFTGWDGSYGWKTVIRMADGTEVWYAHQSQILVHKGQVVAGQIIGRVGATGNTTGPHLHLEIRINGQPVDPKPWLRAHGLNP